MRKGIDYSIRPLKWEAKKETWWAMSDTGHYEILRAYDTKEYRLEITQGDDGPDPEYFKTIAEAKKAAFEFHEELCIGFIKSCVIFHK